MRFVLEVNSLKCSELGRFFSTVFDLSVDSLLVFSKIIVGFFPLCHYVKPTKTGVQNDWLFFAHSQVGTGDCENYGSHFLK